MMTFLSPNLPDSHLYKMANIIYVFNGVKGERGGKRKRGEMNGDGEGKKERRRRGIRRKGRRKM